MTELIAALSSAPIYVIVILSVFALILIGIAVPIIKLILKKIENLNSFTGPGGIKIDLGKSSGDGKALVATVSISNKTYKLIIDSVEATIKDYTTERHEIKETAFGEYYKKRERCVQNAIDGIRLSYQLKTDDSAAGAETTDNFLKLFLDVEFGTILREELIGVFKNPRLSHFSEIEESDELKRITDSCATRMTLSLRKYTTLINAEILKGIVGSTNAQLRDTIYDAIKFFVRLSKKEQEDMLEMHKHRMAELEKRLLMVLDVETGEKKE